MGAGKRLLAVVGASILLATCGAPSTAEAAQKKPQLAPVAVFTIDVLSPGILMAPDAAADWSKNTNISVVLGSCSGFRCIHLERVAQADSYCAGVNGRVLGCRQSMADGSNVIQLTDDVLFDGYHNPLQQSVIEHETGHTFPLGHNDADPNSVMNSAIETQQMRNQYNTVDAGDRKDVQALYPR